MSIWLVLVERLDVDDAALGLLGGVGGGHLQGSSAFLRSSSLVRSVTARWAAAALLRVGQAEGQHHLALPEGDGVVDGESRSSPPSAGVAGLDEADLGGHLDGDRRGSAPGRRASFQSGRSGSAMSLAAWASSGRPVLLGLVHQGGLGARWRGPRPGAFCRRRCTWKVP